MGSEARYRNHCNNLRSTHGFERRHRHLYASGGRQGRCPALLRSLIIVRLSERQDSQHFEAVGIACENSRMYFVRH